MKPSPVDRTFDLLSNGMHNSFLTKCHLEHYSTEATMSLSLCASVYMCFVVKCWERADFLALVCGV